MKKTQRDSRTGVVGTWENTVKRQRTNGSILEELNTEILIKRVNRNILEYFRHTKAKSKIERKRTISYAMDEPPVIFL